ncbi:MAG: hypothetical protein JO250_11805 [Armatimonadetes bacterium]|nr:hypothetical protein [Armatimonadota bacterium]
MSYLDDGRIRLGVDLGLGGAITYLSRAGSDVNVVNSFDWGRQIQMSFYSGPIPFTPHGKQPQPAWAPLGWNPIQSGDAFGNRSRVIESRNDGREIYVKCIPMQWPLNNEPGECTFESWIRLDGDTARVRGRLVNHRADQTQYSGRGQELPAIYTNGPWYRLMTYTGDRPFTGDAVNQIPSKFPWPNWQATENWAALVNEAGWGLGVWEPGVTLFGGGFSGKPGTGGPKDDPTGYIAPVYEEILDHDIVYDFQYVLILGNLDEIRAYVYAHAPRPAPPDYRFQKDRQHWRYVNATDTGWPIRGELKVTLDQNDPQMIGPDGFWLAAQAPKLFLRAAFHTGSDSAQVFWKRFDAPDFSESQSLTFPILPDGRYHTYVVNLSASPEYRGAITGLRLDPEPAGRPGDFIRVQSIRLGR